MTRIVRLLPAAAMLLASAERPHPYAVPKGVPKPIFFAPQIVSTGDDESHPTFSPDGRALYFLKNTPDFRHWTILVTHWLNGRWTTPDVAPFSGQYSDADVSFSPDGKRLFFISTRPSSPGGEPLSDPDIWVIQKDASGNFVKPKKIEELAADGADWFPTLTATGYLYFGSERTKGNLGRPGTSDLWRSKWSGDHFDEPENLGPTINTAGQDIEAYVAPDESFMILASNGRKDTRGSYDLYVSWFCRGRWEDPINLGDVVNTPAWEFGARVSPDGQYLFFTSNRSFNEKSLGRPVNYTQLMHLIRGPGNGLRDIYQIELRSVLPPRPSCE